MSRAETMAKNANNLYAQVRLRELMRLWAFKNNEEQAPDIDFEDDYVEVTVSEEV